MYLMTPDTKYSQVRQFSWLVLFDLNDASFMPWNVWVHHNQDCSTQPKKSYAKRRVHRCLITLKLLPMPNALSCPA